MKDEVKNFISKYYFLFERIGLYLDYKLYDYESAYANNGDFIDYIDGIYSYGGCERGICEVEFQSSDIEDCMYLPVRSAIHNIAFDYELKNRISDLDCRVLGFGMMFFYMDKFHNEKWNNRLYSELLSIIKLDNLPEDLIFRVAKTGNI